MSIYFTVGLDGLAAANQYLPAFTVIPGEPVRASWRRACALSGSPTLPGLPGCLFGPVERASRLADGHHHGRQEFTCTRCARSRCARQLGRLDCALNWAFCAWCCDRSAMP
jgi:hypothetical protein